MKKDTPASLQGKDGSTRVVYAALVGNVLVALSKFGAAALSGSSAMLTEAVHSSADCTNQILLLIGTRRSRTPADAGHPFGYGGEIYYWTFVVAVMVLLAGGVVSAYEGIHHLANPRKITSPGVSLGVLALAAVFEGVSLYFGYRESRRVIAKHVAPGERVGLWRFIKQSKDPDLYESLLEDSAALIGLGIAAFGVVGNAFLGLLWADGAASIAVGVLLVATSWVISEATRRLIAGEAVVRALGRKIEAAFRSSPELRGFSDLRTLHLGPGTILITAAVELDPARSVGDAKRDLDTFTGRLKAIDPRIAHVYFRLQ